ncbi:alpha/beta fold hydrolase [Amycolatopsis lurida]
MWLLWSRTRVGSTCRPAPTAAPWTTPPPGWTANSGPDEGERAGHAVHALTLTGLRPDDDNTTVATHANDVLRLLDRADLTSATLVGHSYGGMVIAAAADRARGRVSRLVHLDAYVPRDGESCWSSTTEGFRQVFAAVPSPSRRSCKRSGSPARSPRFPVGSSSTAGPRPPDRPRRDARGPGGRRRTTAR